MRRSGTTGAPTRRGLLDGNRIGRPKGVLEGFVERLFLAPTLIAIAIVLMRFAFGIGNHFGFSDSADRDMTSHRTRGSYWENSAPSFSFRSCPCRCSIEQPNMRTRQARRALIIRSSVPDAPDTCCTPEQWLPRRSRRLQPTLS